ncbi:hypothetical protein TNCT_170261 [Trichonephila clavata]|uniref:Uncharacterized protein n=1 Tax=Trichonephila clavata TaxID=2740835 RepID=A0A8X6HFN4_TRICU|nr:hypothetical protein TNCT_170261 [Trichonephila clavata]
MFPESIETPPTRMLYTLMDGLKYSPTGKSLQKPKHFKPTKDFTITRDFHKRLNDISEVWANGQDPWWGRNLT